MVAPNRKGGSGRKKTVIRRIEQEDARHVCFSKRRLGFFSKASELAVLTGAQVAALAFSPGGKAFSFGHPSVDSVVERFLAEEGLGAGAREQGAADDCFLAGEGAGAGAGEGAADEDNKLRKLHQEFAELRTELTEVKKRTQRAVVAVAKDRAAGDQIAAWVDPDVRDMGDEDMAAFFAALMQVKTAVSERANQVLVEALHVDISRKVLVEATPPPPPQLFGGSSSNAGMEMQLAVLPPQGQVFEAVMDMQQIMALPLPQGLTAGMDMQEMPPPPGLAAGMDMEQMQMAIPRPPGYDDGMGLEIQQLLMAMPPPPLEFPAGMEMVQHGLEPNASFPY